ncbi:hypothetical protein CJP74_07900 [Psittacicella melopsittaci]|uniref:Rhodanese domain-containing protein n=1 Tax=Psittacicella melopsittaci TaxID=2028576 RepID=A0A3A1Y1L7_9GAMM|nr:rhodanese-like domain-containing protein [Psittacicella melopsittaci]RIY31189.1 hypothetical protein CJP74_07900 [Psittacicella melopsittaci]
MENPIKTISVEELNNLINQGKEVVIFDMRRLDEYNQGHIKDAIHLTSESFFHEANYFNDDTIVVMQCYHGNASKAVTYDLTLKGFDNIYSLDGGITAWVQAGYPLV